MCLIHFFVLAITVTKLIDGSSTVIVPFDAIVAVISFPLYS